MGEEALKALQTDAVGSLGVEPESQPLLLAAAVHADVRVAELRQLASQLWRGIASDIAAVDDDWRGLARGPGRGPARLPEWDVDRARDVGAAELVR